MTKVHVLRIVSGLHGESGKPVIETMDEEIRRGAGHLLFGEPMGVFLVKEKIKQSTENALYRLQNVSLARGLTGLQLYVLKLLVNILRVEKGLLSTKQESSLVMTAQSKTK